MINPNDKPEIYVAVWAKTVETQMHFNEMSVKSRQFGLAFVAAALGLAIVLWSRGEEFAISVNLFGGFDLHATVLIILAAAAALFAVRILDLNVYHRMLRGAVTFGEDFEENYMKQIFQLEKGMTQAISHYSRFSDADVETIDRKYKYKGRKKKSALKRIGFFYNVSIFTLIFVAAALLYMSGNFGNAEFQKRHTVQSQMQPNEQSQLITSTILKTNKK